MPGAPVVAVRDLAKEFRLPHEQVHTLKERVLHPLRRTGHDRLRALDGVSFDVHEGEFFGIVGRNGSGKSTLLKCLAGIYKADRGTIGMRGRLSTFIELGVGFNPDLPARDNVLINGIMLGLTPREALRRFDAIIAFAELEEFVDLKLKNYSSGMQVRLAFSVMVQVDADILLIDEVLAVGDANFQQKCFAVFQRLKDEGKTILFVTHDMASVRRFCDRALLLERGTVEYVGEPEDVGARYLQRNFEREGAHADADADEGRIGDGSVEIADAWLEQDGERTEVLVQGRRVSCRVRLRFAQPLEDPACAILVENDAGQPLFAVSNEETGVELGRNGAGDERVLSFAFDNVFAPGRLFVTPWVVHRGGAPIADRRRRLVSVMNTAVHSSGGLVDLPVEATVE